VHHTIKPVIGPFLPRIGSHFAAILEVGITVVPAIETVLQGVIATGAQAAEQCQNKGTEDAFHNI
jgi:hypothetical protein